MRTRPVLSIELSQTAEADHGEYPFSIPAVGGLRRLNLDANVVFFVGENGSGKSTILEALAIALGFNAEGGSKNFRFSTKGTHSNLHRSIKVVKGARLPSDGFFLRGETFYNVASEIDRLDEAPSFDPPVKDAYGGKSLHQQSHGEAFWATIMNRFRGGGLYILDEPESALSPQRQLSVLARMLQLVKEHAQFVIATHSPVLLAFPDALIYDLGDSGIQEVQYEDTMPFQIMRAFMADPHGMIRRLSEE